MLSDLDPLEPTVQPPTRASSLHRSLNTWNRERLSPALPNADWAKDLAESARLLALEGHWVEQERRTVSERAARVPGDADAFVAWFEALKYDGPGQNDSLFPWLAESAPLQAMRWFLRQEVAGEAGFDDLVALTQIKLPQVANWSAGCDRAHRAGAGGLRQPRAEAPRPRR
jgi:hypothetical protein